MRIRMFISIPVEGPEAIQPLLTELRLKDNVKPSPIGQMHITLRFIGDIDDGKTKKVVACVQDAVRGIGPFDITIGGVGCFPNRRNPSVVWLGAEPGDVLARISDGISANLKAMNISFDEKPFKSHITIGRCRGKVDIDGFLDAHSKDVVRTFRCDGVCIMRSELSPSGARHTVLARVPLESQH